MGHVHTTATNKAFSEYGHRVGFLASIEMTDAQRKERQRCINSYLERYAVKGTIPGYLPEYHGLQEIRRQVLELFAKADKLTEIVRSKSSAI